MSLTAEQNRAMEADVLWKAAMKPRFPQDLENGGELPPPFPTSPTAPTSDQEKKRTLKTERSGAEIARSNV